MHDIVLCREPLVGSFIVSVVKTYRYIDDFERSFKQTDHRRRAQEEAVVEGRACFHPSFVEFASQWRNGTRESGRNITIGNIFSIYLVVLLTRNVGCWKGENCIQHYVCF